MHHFRSAALCLLLLLISSLVSCSHGSSNTDNNPSTNQPPQAAPFVSTLSPTTIVSSPDQQSIMAIGGNLTGVSATLRFMPQGFPQQEFDSQPIAVLDDSHVAVSGTFLPGPWSLELTNGAQSTGQMPFQVQQASGNTQNGVPPDPYNYPLATATADSVDPWGFFTRECTSYVAWVMNVIHGTRTKPWFFTDSMGGQTWSNAEHWDTTAKALGFPVDTTPQIGAVAQWHSDEIHFADGSNVPGGHVAVVVSINGDGSVMVADYNFKKFAFDLHPETPPRFIHIVDTPGANPSFVLNASPSAQTMQQGQRASFSIQLSSIGGFSGPVTWMAIDLPPGYAAGTSDQPTTIPLSPGTSANGSFLVNTNLLTTPGTYNITLRATSPGVSSTDITITLTILPNNALAPTAIMSLTGNGQTGGNGSTLVYTVPPNANVVVNFNSSFSTAGTGSIVSTVWKSNGTVISTQPSFSLPFGTPSNTITLTVTNSAGLSSTATATILVQTSSPSAPQAVMSLSGAGQTGGNGSTLVYTVPPNGNVVINFDSSSSTPGTGSIVSTVWKSNGTVISTQPSFSLPFGTPSNTITLTVTNSTGLSSTAMATILVQISSPSAPQAVMILSGGGQSGGNGSRLVYTVPPNGNVVVNFDSSSSTAGTGSIVSTVWESNGTVISRQPSFSYAFGTPSNTITLTVTNSAGLTSTATATIVVQISSPSAPQAVMFLTGGGQTGGNGSTLVYTVPINGNMVVNFDSSSSTPGTGSIVSTIWESNGTVISRQPSFSYTFGTPSNTITLTVTNSAGFSSTATALILIQH